MIPKIKNLRKIVYMTTFKKFLLIILSEKEFNAFFNLADC